MIPKAKELKLISILTSLTPPGNGPLKIPAKKYYSIIIFTHEVTQSLHTMNYYLVKNTIL